MPKDRRQDSGRVKVSSEENMIDAGELDSFWIFVAVKSLSSKRPPEMASSCHVAAGW